MSDAAPRMEVNEPERLSADDMASRAEEEAREAALARHAWRAAAQPASKPGVCRNCQLACLPRAIYCDDDCRQDHEARMQTLRRQGLAS